MDFSINDDLSVSQAIPVQPVQSQNGQACENAISPEKKERKLELCNEAIGNASIRQFRRMNQDYDTAMLIYTPGCLEGRASLKISDPWLPMIQDIEAWMKWVKAEWWRVQMEVETTRANKKSDEYWMNIKKNFDDLLETRKRAALSKS